MKRLVLLSLACSSIICMQSHSQSLTKIWETDTLTTTPESVLYEPTEKVLYVACINGKPSAENNSSFIAKVELDGKIRTLKFATDLNSTKGMGIMGNKLFVTEMFKIVELDIKTGKVIKKYDVPEAKFLNDIAVDAKSGVVYFSDSGNPAIWMLKNGQLTKLLSGTPLKNPNGVFYENETLLVGNGDGILYRYNLKTKALAKVAEGMGGIDGIAPDGNGNYIISEWGGKIWFAKADGTIKEMLNTVDQKINTADLDYAKDKNLVFVPTFFHNTVAAYQLNK